MSRIAFTTMLVAGLVAGLVVPGGRAMAQDTTRARHPRPDSLHPVPPQAPSDTMVPTFTDTTTRDRPGTVPPPFHLDSGSVDSLALDTLRRGVHRDSMRASAVRDSMQNAVNCNGRRISAIDIRPQPPYLGIPANSKLAAFLRQAARWHSTTRGPIIRRFLALRVGGRCTEERRVESERLLRAQPFIQSAHVTAFDDGQGGVRLDVYTVDELAGEIQVGIGRLAPFINALRLGNGNLLGNAMRVTGNWAHTPNYADQIGGEFADFQTFGHPWVFDASAQRAHVGGDIDASMSHPYFVDLQSIGWRVAGGSDHDYFQFRNPGDVYAPTLDVERVYFNAGGLLRIGNPSAGRVNTGDSTVRRINHLAIVGLAVSHERDGIGGGPVLITPTGLQHDTTTATANEFAGHFGAHTEDRLNLLVGVRAVRYITVVGMDALLGEQDIPLGGQFSAVVGRSAAWLGSGAHDLFLSGRLDLAAGSRNSVIRGGIESEARHDEASGRWDGLITSGRAAWYIKPGLARTIIISTDIAYGQRLRVPFQLALGDANGGVPGYLGTNVAGAARGVGRAEYRTLFRPPLHFLRTAATWGLAGFVDGGRVWAGDIPFGTTSPTVGSAGVGLLVGVPRASRQLWRVDLAQPLVSQPRSGLEIRVSYSSAARVWWTESPDVTRSRERTVTPSLFSYP
ncbi:MAG: hypothetical protein ACHQTF_08190 [Gemmatimonadales bacterium]